MPQVQVLILHEHEYYKWKDAFRLALESEGISEAIDRQLPEDSRANRLAMAKFRQNVLNHLSAPLLRQKSTFEALNALDKVMIKNQDIMAKVIIADLKTKRIMAFDLDTDTKHLNYFMGKCHLLGELGRESDEQAQLDILADTLPLDHDNSGNKFGQLAQQLRTYELLVKETDLFKRTCSKWHEDNIAVTFSTAALFTRNQGRLPHRGRGGHVQNYTPAVRRCFRCNATDHIIWDCLKKDSFRVQGGHQNEAFANFPHKLNSTSSSYSVLSTRSADKFILDLGTTAHHLRAPERFETFRPTKESLVVANGEQCTSMGEGTAVL